MRVFIGCLCACGCEILFGLSYLFTKQATAHAGIWALLGWRFLVALLGMGLCAAFGLFRFRLRGKSFRPLLRLALFSPIGYFIGETVGIYHTTVAESGVFLTGIPIAALVASSLILHEPPSFMQLVGICVTVLGVLVNVLAAGGTASFSPLGYIMLFMAVISYALYSVLAVMAQAYSAAEMTLVMVASGAVFFGACAVMEAAFSGDLHGLWQLPFRERHFLGAVLYQGIGCSVIAFFLSNMAILRLGVNRAASFIGVSTLVSVGSGVFLLGEPFSALQMAGGAAIIGGVVIANWGVP